MNCQCDVHNHERYAWLSKMITMVGSCVLNAFSIAHVSIRTAFDAHDHAIAHYNVVVSVSVA